MKLTKKQIVRYRDRKVVLVDEENCVVGEGDLIEAHREGGKKHRAFSLVLYRKIESRVEVLLQRRAAVKPIFSGLWANTCCYNLAPGEEIVGRAKSRVKEELGIDLEGSSLSELYRFSYEAEGEGGWWENEVDHIIVGEIYGEIVITPNPDEVMDYKWIEWEKMKEWMMRKPGVFAPWWKMMVADGRVERHLSE